MSDEELEAEIDETPEEELTPFGHRLMAALQVAIAEMRKQELLEVKDEFLEPLLLELTHAGVDASSPKQLLKKVRGTLIHSELVEEVYATDAMLDDILKASLG